MGAFKVSYPEILHPLNAAPAFQTTTLDATTDRLGIIIRVEEPMTVTSVKFRQGSVSNTPDNLRVGIQTVNTTTGMPDGNWYGGLTNYSDYTPITANNNSFVTRTLPSSITLGRGEVIALVMQPIASGGGGWDTNDMMTISRSIANTTHGHRGPYVAENTAKATVQNAVFGLITSTRTYGNPIENIISRSNNNVGTSGALTEYGHYFRVPTNVCSTYQINGVRIGGAFSLGDWSLRLYDTDGTTVLQEVLVDKDEVSSATAHPSLVYFETATLATLNAGSYYRLVFRPTTGTATGSIYAFDLDLPIDRGCYVANPDDIFATERSLAGAWVQSDLRIWAMQALICDITPPVGGGGLAANPLAGYVR